MIAVAIDNLVKITSSSPSPRFDRRVSALFWLDYMAFLSVP